MSTDDKKDEQKTERFNMFMSPSEMKAIDEWAWASHIRSKSEAVRRLCQIGMISEEPVLTYGDATHDLLERVRQHHNAIVALQNRAKKGEKLDLVEELELLSQGSVDLHERLEILQVLAVNTHNLVVEFTSEDPIDEGLHAAEDWRAKAAAHIKRLGKKHARRKK